MSKYIKRMGTKKEKFFIEMKIISLEIPVKELIEKVKIEWVRGKTKSTTEYFYELSPENPIAKIDENFTNLSVFYKDKKDKYFKKDALIRVVGLSSTSRKEKLLG